MIGFQDVAARLDALVRTSRIPGVLYVVVDAKSTRFEYHGGAADLASRRPMLADTSMMAHSMSKTITAAAVLQLVECGRIGLDDAASRHTKIPYGDAITIRHLPLPPMRPSTSGRRSTMCCAGTRVAPARRERSTATPTSATGSSGA